jgi:hypothetical protein
MFCAASATAFKPEAQTLLIVVASIVEGRALDKSKVPVEKITDVYMGNVLQGSVGQAPARQASPYHQPPVLLLGQVECFVRQVPQPSSQKRRPC